MEYKLQLLENCENSILNQDYDYGLRKLLNAVISSKNYEFYKRSFNIVEAYSNENFTEFNNLSLALISDLKEAEFSIKVNQKSFIETKALRKTYQNGKFTLGTIDLKVSQGELIGLVGENGNGKTTLLRILAKDLAYSSGSIHSNFESETIYSQRTNLVYIPQRTPKRYGKLKDNLKFVAAHYGIKGKANELEVLMAIARMGLWKYKSLYWKELSSGYKMRFELARVLLRKPRILLLDEPLANLDVLAQQVVLEDLKSLTTNAYDPMAVILSSQQLYEVEKISDHIIFLKNGKPNNQLNLGENEYNLIIELETDAERAVLMEQLKPEKIEFNGGNYVLFFNDLNITEFLQLLLSNKISVKYLRDITNSSRRFFV